MGFEGKDDWAPIYTKHLGTYLSDHAEGDMQVRGAKAARRRCDELGSLCSGITCEVDGSPPSACTVRSGADLVDSPTGEISYRKEERVPVARELSVAGASAFFQFYTGSQSVVHKDRIRAWQRADFMTLGADGPFCSEFSGYFEGVWHVMFGEPLSQWPRERDPALPLYLKWSIPTLLYN